MTGRLKRVFVFLLVFIIGFGVLSPMDVRAASSAVERVETFVGLAAGKSSTNADVLSSLTQDELQFLGVYLSNFYVPFSTELGSSDTEVLDTQKSQMVQALSNGLNFNQTVAESLVDYVIGLTRSNLQDLEFRVSVSYQPTNASDYKVLEGFDVNYYTFVNCMMGGMFDSSTYPDAAGALGGMVYNAGWFTGKGWMSGETLSEDEIKGILRDFIENACSVREGYTLDYVYECLKSDYGVTDSLDTCLENYTYLCYMFQIICDVGGLTSVEQQSAVEQDIEAYESGSAVEFPYNYGYFGYSRDGVFIPMFDCSFNGTVTASMEVFAQCLNTVNWTKGYGLGFFDFTTEDVDGGGKYSDIYGALSDWDDDILYDFSAYGTDVRVDCFGNIIAMGANHQYIIVPGCMNPYTWISVGSNGRDIGSAGENYNVITFQGMSLANRGTLFESGSSAVREANGTLISIAGGYNRLADMMLSSEYYQVLESEADRVTAPGGGMGISVNAVGVPWRIMRGSGDYTVDDSIWYGSEGIDFMKRVESVLIESNTGKWYWLSWDGGFTDSESVQMNNSILLALPMNSGYRDASVSYIDRMVFIDNIGAFGFDSSNSDIEYSAIQFSNYLADNGTASRTDFASWASDARNEFSNTYQDISKGEINTEVPVSDNAIIHVYTSYAIAGLYESDSLGDTVGRLGWRINREGLPQISNDPILLPSSVADDIVNTNIRNWIYYILHPTEGMDYVKILLRNKVNAILVDWHNSMVGTTGTGITTGTTYYRTNYGYVTTPDLSEIQWTNSLLTLYNNLIPAFVVIMLISMVLAFVTGTLSLQKSIFSFVIFSAFLLVPVNAINWVVSASNRLTSNIYGEKFTYWAVVQEETYGSGLDQYATGESYDNYLRYLYSSNEANQGGESIVLKWQAPKKMASLMLSASDNALLDNLQGNLLNGTLLTSSSYSGEAYLDGDNQYLYRDYSDIANFSRYIYNGMKYGTRAVDTNISTMNISNNNAELRDIVSTLSSDYSNYVNSGYTSGNSDYTKALRLTAPMTSDIYRDTLNIQGSDGYMETLTTSSYVGLNQDLFNFSVAMFTNNSMTFEEALNENLTGNNDISSYTGAYSEADFSSLAAYALMSESPFYYYSWKLYDDGMSTSANAYNGYRSLLLSDSENSYFYNTIGNGELIDFMDMRSLFTYIIPLLKEGNDIVKAWDDSYGVYTYDGVYTEEGHINDNEIISNPTLKYEYWHNLNVARLYEIYTPWVDLMYECSYADPEYIRVFGERVLVSDPLNPASYPDERPMIFSESEMYDYGLTEADLTKVERLILDCNRDMQERMYELLNYYNFSDLALNTAAAINCTFEFNTTFSENGIFSDNINLYPQTFEIKDFSYDAFLRFILANTVGTSMTSTNDFYGDLVNQSSTTTAILLLVLDILSQYVVPAFKIFFLIAVLIASILLIFVSVIKVDPEMRFVAKLTKELLVPLAGFFLITIGFAWVISLFMGVGNNAVTQTNTLSISMGDPNITMLAMCAVDIICILLYFMVLKNVLMSIKRNFKMAVNFEAGILGGAVAGVAGFLGGQVGSRIGNGFGSGGSYNEIGSGRESGRASRRASNEDIDSYSDDGGTRESNIRINETNHKTANFGSEQVTDEDRKNSINESIKSGTEKVIHDSDD